MQQKRSRCGIVRRGRCSPRASTLGALCADRVLPLRRCRRRARRRRRAIAGSVTIVIHGQGRGTRSAGGVDRLPRRAVRRRSPLDTTLTLRAAPASGYVTAQLASCTEVDVCTVTLNDFAYTIDVYFRPAGEAAAVAERRRRDHCLTAACGLSRRADRLPARLRTPSRAPAASSTTSRAPGDRDGERRPGEHLPGLQHARLRQVQRLHDQSEPRLVSRRALHSARGPRDPGRQRHRQHRQRAGGIACPPTCTAPFPAGSQVTLVASPDPASPFLSWSSAAPCRPPTRAAALSLRRTVRTGSASRSARTTRSGFPTTLACSSTLRGSGGSDQGPRARLRCEVRASLRVRDA